MKIVICGTRESRDLEVSRQVGEALAGFPSCTVLANGGTYGFPREVPLIAKANRPELLIEAYTPFASEEEWRRYAHLGLSDITDYDHINWLCGQTNDSNLKLRALQRIPSLLDGSRTAIFYASNTSGNTHVEIISANSLEIRSFILTPDREVRDLLKDSYKMILKRGITRFYSDPNELIKDLFEEVDI
ncbi:hypothetical protein J4462_03235 [Candidatus Pacearchaeota archaeon]|nr:hypothetical protein [Candidatus Pacearchaeota archaeon]